MTYEPEEFRFRAIRRLYALPLCNERRFHLAHRILLLLNELHRRFDHHVIEKLVNDPLGVAAHGSIKRSAFLLKCVQPAAEKIASDHAKFADRLLELVALAPP